MLGRIRSRSQREDGQALVELALAIPLLLFVIFVIVDFGLAINTKDSASNVANISAREAAVAGSGTVNCGSTAESTIGAYARCEAAATSAPTPCYVQVTDSPSGNGYKVGDSVTVSISMKFNWLGVITGGVNSRLQVGGLPTTITQTATMRVEQAAGTSTFLTSDTSSSC